MALKVTKSNEPIKVDTLCFTVYAQPGLGKTSLAFTASRPLLLDFDKGAHRAFDRRDTVLVSQWSDVAGITAADVADYDTIIIDTVGKALDTLAQDIIRGNSRLSHGGALSQQGWGQLGVRFSAFLKLLRGFGKDVILIAHMDEQKDNDAIKERLKISGGSKDLILTDSDVIARISIISKQRYLVFSPTETAFGKDPAEIGEAAIPNAGTAEYADYLAGIIAQIKARLNTLSEEQAARNAEIDWFTENLPKMNGADQINSILARAKQAGRDVAMAVAIRAKEIGLTFDKGQGEYLAPKVETPTDQKPSSDDGENTPAPNATGTRAALMHEIHVAETIADIDAMLADPETDQRVGELSAPDRNEFLKAAFAMAFSLARSVEDIENWIKIETNKRALDTLAEDDYQEVRRAWAARRAALRASVAGHQEAA